MVEKDSLRKPYASSLCYEHLPCAAFLHIFSLCTITERNSQSKNYRQCFFLYSNVLNGCTNSISSGPLISGHWPTITAAEMYKQSQLFALEGTNRLKIQLSLTVSCKQSHSCVAWKVLIVCKYNFH